MKEMRKTQIAKMVEDERVFVLCDICRKVLYYEGFGDHSEHYKCSLCHTGDFCTAHMKQIVMNEGDSYNGIDPLIFSLCQSCQTQHKAILDELAFKYLTICNCEIKIDDLKDQLKHLVK
jgi:LSD1 subclass zinc finger protein